MTYTELRVTMTGNHVVKLMDDRLIHLEELFKKVKGKIDHYVDNSDEDEDDTPKLLKWRRQLSSLKQDIYNTNLLRGYVLSGDTYSLTSCQIKSLIEISYK